SFGQDQEFIASESDDGRAEILFLPGYFAAFELDASQTCRRLETWVSTAMDAVQKSGVMNRSCVVAGKRIVVSPEFLYAVVMYFGQGSACTVAGGNEDQITNDQGCRGR